MTATEWTRKEHADYVRWCEEHPEGFAWVIVVHQTLHKATEDAWHYRTIT